MEDIGYVSINSTTTGRIHFEHSFKKSLGAKILKICSLDECGYVITKAAPGTLTTAKRSIRSLVLQK